MLRIEHRRFLRNAKAIPGDFEHALLVANIGDRKIMNVVRKTCIGR